MAVVDLGGESTLALWRDGYLFGHRRFTRYDTDAFRTRILGRPTTVLRGVDAAQFFYGEDRFDRTRLIPRSVLHSLQDEGSVQTLAGGAHRERREYFLQHADEPHGRAVIDEIFRRRLDAAFDQKQDGGPFSVLELVSDVLTAAALDWLDVTVDAGTLRARSAEFVAMIDGAGSFGIRNVRGRVLRRRTERWATSLVAAVSAGDLRNPAVQHALAHTGGDVSIATTEVLNLLRPVVAVARFAAFAALALHRHPEAVEAVAGSPESARAFAHEVRRTAPFFPLIGGAATRDLEGEGMRFETGERVIVDLFATNRSAREWVDAEVFRPDRFLNDPTAAQRIVAQGAGPREAGHRCPGEQMTVDLLASFVQLTAVRRWDVPPQDLRVDLHRLPAQPGPRGLELMLLS